MTLIIACKCSEGEEEQILMTSDSRVTLGPITYETRKIYPITLNDIPLAIAGGSGDSAVIKQAYRICEKILHEQSINNWNSQPPTFEQFEEVVNRIETILVRRFKNLRDQGMDISFNLILGSVDINSKASLYLFDSRGLAQPVHESPGYSIIGMGFFTGGNLLLNLLGCHPENINVSHSLYLSTFIIEVVSEIDPSVGPFIGENWLMKAENNHLYLGSLQEEAVRYTKEEVSKRRDIFKRIWACCDELDLSYIFEKIEELEEMILEPEAEEEEEEEE